MMERDKLLTIGMAHFDDYEGLWPTIQAIRMEHTPEEMKDWEFVVVDNSIATNERVAKDVQNFLGQVNTGGPPVTYVPLPDKIGTSPSRDKIFEVAKGKYTLVVDCHILLRKDAIRRLMAYYAENPETKDILSGPLVYDNLRALYGTGRGSTAHYNDQWRGEMWGTWGTAWQCTCPDGEVHDDGTKFTLIDIGGQAHARTLTMPQEKISRCERCGKKIPGGYEPIPWGNHEDVLSADGFVDLGIGVDGIPFETPGHGLGLFSCRTDVWPRFHPEARGFGGEEMYIHEKFRRNGGKSICLPFLQWNHRFRGPGTVKYPLTRWQKVRNYVLEYQELGLKVDDLYQHFVQQRHTDGEGKIVQIFTDEQWRKLMEDPVKNVTEPGCATCGGGGVTHGQTFPSIEAMYEYYAKTPRDLNEHMPAIRERAVQCKHVTEISKRRESTAALLAGKPKIVKSYNSEILSQDVGDMAQRGGIELTYAPPQAGFDKIDETDLLLIDYDHTYSRTKQYLGKLAPSVKRYIILHDTIQHGGDLPGRNGEDGDPRGLLTACREYTHEHPEWSVIKHYTNQYGLTILGRLEEDKPKLPKLTTMAWNYAQAMAAHLASGGGKVSEDAAKKRLDICTLCPAGMRVGDRCADCGCFLPEKAALPSMECPLGYWGKENPA